MLVIINPLCKQVKQDWARPPTHMAHGKQDRRVGSELGVLCGLQ